MGLGWWWARAADATRSGLLPLSTCCSRARLELGSTQPGPTCLLG